MNEASIVKQRPKWSVAITQEKYQALINNTLNDPERAKRFIAAVSSTVGATPGLQDCDVHSILTSSLLGEALNLSPSPQLGQYYLVPFENKLRGTDGKIIYKVNANGERVKENGRFVPETVKVAQFVLGYKGYIQLAKRSGVYRHINVIEVKQGELLGYNPFTEEIGVDPVLDWNQRRELATVGYYAFFEELNGFKKSLYWSKEQMVDHADTYSPAFSAKAYGALQRGEIADSERWKYSSFWYKDFDAMGKKTMIRQLIGHWGSMSVDFQNAYAADGHVIDDNLLPQAEPIVEEALPLAVLAQMEAAEDGEALDAAKLGGQTEAVPVSMEDL